MNRKITRFGYLATHACAAILLFLSSNPVDASTLVSGNVSGNWTKIGSPYMVIDNCTVPSGQSLIVDPGVTVIIGEGLKLTVNGKLSAIGTISESIIIKGTSASNYWDRIQINYAANLNSVLSHCKISDGDYGIYLDIFNVNGTMATEVSYSSFINCKSACIFIGSVGWFTYGESEHYPVNSPSVLNCNFSSSKNAIVISISGRNVTPFFASGSSNPNIKNCTFNSISNVAIDLSIGSFPGDSKPLLVNNVINNCNIGIKTISPYDLSLYNSVISDCKIGIVRDGSLSSQIGYTCFFNNQTNLIGYPNSYGKIILQNHNGTPSDVAMNIFVNPAFAEKENFTLAANSPCIDAGDPNTNYNDKFFPPSLGTEINDMGAYGGPGAVMPVISTTGDQDGDGIPDSWMIKYFGHATGQENDITRAQDDYEDDGLSNAQEFEAGTDPTKADTDGDGFNDKTEIEAGSDPLDPQSTPPPQLMIRVKQVELEFISGNGKTNVIQASSDCKTWSQVEQILGTGTSVSRIYSVTNNMRYFRLLQP